MSIYFSRAYANVHGPLQDRWCRFKEFSTRIISKIQTFAAEAFATIRYVLPLSILWLYETRIKKALTVEPVQFSDKIKIQATLYSHGTLHIEKGKSYQPVLLLHGDYGHPFTLRHLATGLSGPVFSLYIPKMHNNEQFADQAALVDEVISYIESLIVNKGGIFHGVLAVGHSKGGMLLAERQFCSPNSHKIAKTFVVGSPLMPNSEFTESLNGIFKKVIDCVKEHTSKIIFQVIPEKDWSVDNIECMMGRPQTLCFKVPGRHLSGLYSKRTKEIFEKFILLAPYQFA